MISGPVWILVRGSSLALRYSDWIIYINLIKFGKDLSMFLGKADFVRWCLMVFFRS